MVKNDNQPHSNEIKQINNKLNLEKMKIEKVKMTVEYLEKIIPDPIWEQNKNTEDVLKNSVRFKGRTPIECLEINGYEIFEVDENVLIYISHPNDIWENIKEGIFGPREKPFSENNTQFVPEEKIKDYNSLWEITETGWDTKGEILLYPYIGIREKGSDDDFKFYRWDNSYILRPLCLTHQWSEENFTKFYSSSQFKSMIESQPI